MDKAHLSKRAYLLHLSAASIANGIKNGMFRSLFYGHGVEFRGVREYLRGDDVRAIDRNVTARMGKPFVKIFEEERELDVFIILDKSLSMGTGSEKQTRMETAAECAQLVAMASFRNESPVGAVTFDGKIQFSSSPKSGMQNLMRVLKEFEKQQTEKNEGSALNSALNGAEKLLRKRTLVLVISDFRTTGWEDSFARLCQKNDVIAIRITDPLDASLPKIGSVLFSDPETDHKCILPCSSKEFSKAWASDNSRRTDIWKKACLSRGGIPLIISTKDDAAGELIKFFDTREKLS